MTSMLNEAPTNRVESDGMVSIEKLEVPRKSSVLRGRLDTETHCFNEVDEELRSTALLKTKGMGRNPGHKEALGQSLQAEGKFPKYPGKQP